MSVPLLTASFARQANLAQGTGTNTIVTDLPLKVVLLFQAFGPIVPYHQDRAKLKP
jgi:hypothetical protein